MTSLLALFCILSNRPESCLVIHMTVVNNVAIVEERPYVCYVNLMENISRYISGNGVERAEHHICLLLMLSTCS